MASVRDELKSIIQDTIKESIDENMHKLNSEIEHMTSVNITLKERVIKLEQALDDAEQYSRRNFLRTSRFPEQANELPDEIKNAKLLKDLILVYWVL